MHPGMLSEKNKMELTEHDLQVILAILTKKF